MTERRGATTGFSSNYEIIKIKPDQRGLIGQYLKSKRESMKHGVIADALKRAIVERSEGLVNIYTEFVGEEFSDNEASRYLHPRKKHSHHGKPKKHTETYERILESETISEKRKIKYTKTTIGNKTSVESVRIENPDASDGTFRYLNLTTGMFEMREASSMQNLVNGEPHIFPLSDEKDQDKFSDILDVFTDEIMLLQKLSQASNN